MTKFILHGGYERADNELNRTFYEELVRDIPDGGTVLLVYFASEPDDIQGKFIEQIERIKEQSHGKNLNFALATEEGFIEELKNSDAVHFRGGNTSQLLKILRTYPDFSSLLEGKTVSGSSAGAYALVRLGAAHSQETVREGLGFLPLRLVCHYESPDLPPSPESFSSLRDMAPDLELVLLKDCEWRIFEQNV